ncbi:MAG: hypothetical protein J6V25_01190 [Oscillospiraceae bacterium]|nr:hypothetical protein [Oscillospiraceae bacterium]
MQCMRCGKNALFDNVFCDSCLKEMNKYPVNPNTPVSLPKRSEYNAARKTVRKRSVPLEDQILLLKNRIRILSILLTVVSILAALLIYPAVKYLLEDHFLPGQNYTSIVSKTSTTEPSDAN